MTTDVLIKEIVDVDDSVSLTPFIAVAHSLVDELLSGDFEQTRLDLIETWLAAHFYVIRENRLVGEDLDFMEYRYQNQYKLGLNFNVSMYGQQVLILDTTGKFAKLNRNAGVSTKEIPSGRGIDWLGVTSS